MKSKITIYNHSFDELLTAKYLFEQRVVSEDEKIGKRILSITNACYTNHAMGEILRIVTKYLLHADVFDEENKDKQTPTIVRDLVWKWLVIVIYQKLRKSPKLRCEKLEKFNNGITVKKLIDLEINDDSIYAMMLERKKDKPGAYENNLDKIHNIIKDNLNLSNANLFSSMYRLNMNFFQYNQQLKYYAKDSVTKKIELIVCDEMFDDKFKKYSFEIIDLDNFKKNLTLQEKGKDRLFTDAYIFTGIYINDYLSSNYKYHNTYDLNRNRINIATLDKEFKVSSVVNFIEDNDTFKRKVLKNKIVSFEFKYNDENYLFSKDGIKKIDRD